MSWIPAARESRVGAKLSVMRERREAIADGGIGGNGVAEVDDDGAGSGAGCAAMGSIVARIFCCDGSNSDKSILSSVADLGAEDSGCDSASDSLGIGGLIRGMDGGRRSAFRECRSRCSLIFVLVPDMNLVLDTSIPLYLFLQLLDLLGVLDILRMRLFDYHSRRCCVFPSKPVGQLGIC